MIRKICISVLIEFPVRLFSMYFSLIDKLVKSTSYLHAQKIYHELGNRLPLTFTHEGIVFDAATKTPMSRGYRLLTKEPDTINWLDDYLAVGNTFYDVGANIGVYSLYAAKRGNTVVAIEPESSSYAILNKNIYLNGFDRRVTALNLALYDQEVLSVLNISNFQPGKSGHSFHDEVDTNLIPCNSEFRQAVIGIPLDTLISRYDLEFPNLIKIDVDGNEHKIIEGMPKTLGDKRLKSIALETNLKIGAHKQLEKILCSFGFRLLIESRYVNAEYEKVGTPNHFFLRDP